MLILIKTLRHAAFALEVKPTDLIQDIKARIRQKEGTAVSEQWLASKGKPLVDGFTIADYHICENDTIYVSRRQNGGARETK
jgi:hypothetical protein